MSGWQIVVFGLSVSSSWGNGHATLWRGLCRALAKRGHKVTFFEKETPFYANSRDLHALPGGGTLRLYRDAEEIRAEAQSLLRSCDVAIVTSFCPDGAVLSGWVLESQAAARVFYDLDTPVTLDALRSGEPVPYLPEGGLAGFDLVLSYTGGQALEELQSRLGAQRVAPLYGWVDTTAHYPWVRPEGRSEEPYDLSYLGTYAEDRQEALERLLIAPARRLPQSRFLIGGAQYPQSFPWERNIFFRQHVPPTAHPEFFGSSRWTLNVTRRAMAAYGYCPSGRLFEAAACGVPLITDAWEGLESFLTPGEEIVVAQSSDEVADTLAMTDAERRRIAARALERVREEHTAEARAKTLEALCLSARRAVLAEAS